MFGTKILEERKSKYNGNLKVVRSLGFGTYIQADGLTQSGGVVSDIWRPVLRKIHNSKFIIHNSLILGLGGGTAAKFIRKYWPKAKITGVDIDPKIIELGKRYLNLDKYDVDIKIGDAGKYVGGTYDLVIVDLYNGDNFPKKFENAKFLRLLSKNKLVVINRLKKDDGKKDFNEFERKLKGVFDRVSIIRPLINVVYICLPKLLG